MRACRPKPDMLRLVFFSTGTYVRQCWRRGQDTREPCSVLPYFVEEEGTEKAALAAASLFPASYTIMCTGLLVWSHCFRPLVPPHAVLREGGDYNPVQYDVATNREPGVGAGADHCACYGGVMLEGPLLLAQC